MILNDALLKAISWTLIHSMWQGIILAFCAGLIILTTKKANAALRYNLLSGLFVVFIVIVALTFNYEFMPQGYETVTRINLPIVNSQVTVGFPETGAANISDSIIGFLNGNAHLIAMIWLCLFTVKLIGIFHSLNHVYRIRNYKTFSPSDYWKNRVCELADQIHIRKSIVLLESALVKVPSVTGFLKPIILVPVGMLSNLPQDQVEAILLHELAHIRRKDYAINLLQHLAEMIFFFNPGLLWLSSLLKDERENCCDDIALGVIGNKAGFVHALVSFEEFNSHGQLAIGFAGKKNHLLNRAKRIIHNDNKSLNAIEKTFLSLSLLFVALIMIACANPNPNEINRATAEAAIASEHAQIMAENAAIASEATNASDLDQQSAEADRIYQETQLAAMQAKQDQLSAIADANKMQNAMVCTPIPVASIAEPLEKAAPVEIAVPKNHSVTTRTVTYKTETAQSYEREVMTYDAANSKNNKHVSLRTGVTGQNLPEMNVDNLTSSIISDLMRDNIIKDTQGLSYKLSNKSLIVNGVRQPENVYFKLKSKYVKAKMYAICYNYEYSSDLPLD